MQLTYKQGSRMARWRKQLAVIGKALTASRRDPACAWQMLQTLPAACRAYRLGSAWNAPVTVAQQTPAGNPLWDYFANHAYGRGICKWHHYFEVYHRHLARVTQRPVHVVEVGVLGGDSLDMWAHYFDAQCHVYGIDVRPESKQYERDHIHIFIGDQQDRRFWLRSKRTCRRWMS